MVRAHRLAYQLVHGPIPNAFQVCHTCDTPLCCRPDHLWLGTNAENQADCTRKGRRPFGDKNGSRTCPGSRPRGAQHWKARLTAADVQRIRTAGEPPSVVARALAISRTHVHRIRAGTSWKEEQ